MTKKAALSFIFFTVVIDMIGVGLIVPSLPGIMRRLLADPMQASQAFGYFISIYAVMQFVASPLLGVLSDLWGRRPILLLSLAFAAADHCMMAFAPTLTLLFIGRALAGLTSANITVAMAYIADISDEKKRAANFGLIGAAFGLGFVIGPALGGVVAGLGPKAPFLFAAGLNLFNFLYGYFILPESLPLEKRQKFSVGRLNPFKALARAVSNPALRMFFLAHFLFQLAGQTHPSIWTLYTQHRFGWTVAQVGLSLAFVGLMSGLAQAVLTRVIPPRLGEERTLFYCGVGYTISMLAFGLAPNGWFQMSVLFISAPAWILGPVLQSLASRRVSAAQQGELQGSMVSLTSLACIINPLIVTQLFAHFSKPEFPVWTVGAPYFFAALASALGWVVVSFVSRGENDTITTKK